MVLKLNLYRTSCNQFHLADGHVLLQVFRRIVKKTLLSGCLDLDCQFEDLVNFVEYFFSEIKTNTLNWLQDMSINKFNFGWLCPVTVL